MLNDLVAQLQEFSAALAGFANGLANTVWAPPMFFLLLGCGLVFTIATKFVQGRILTHGIACIRGRYDKPNDTGHVNHFQALCAALSGTIGLGNIAGVAVAVAVGGPGAIFWMWVIGVLGMTLKFMECTLAVMYRDKRRKDGKPEDDAAGFDPAVHEVRGGPMWYIQKALVDPIRKRGNPVWMVFKILAIVFAAGTAVSALGQGNMFQGWNVANVLNMNFGVPEWISAIIMAALVAVVIIGGIRRIGEVASRLVPFMCAVYILGALYVIILHADEIPYYLDLIVRSAFTSTAEMGAFTGVSVWLAFQHGLRRAMFSNEAGQGSAAMAHAAARTEEPVREGVVAGIGPFIDTLIICTMSALVLLMTGVWNRPAVGRVAAIEDGHVRVAINADVTPQFQEAYLAELTSADGINVAILVERTQGNDPVQVELPVQTFDGEPADGWAGITGLTLTLPATEDAGLLARRAKLAVGQPVHVNASGAELTRFAFDTTLRGFGKYMITLAVCLFAFSTMLTWSYYGERGAEYLFGAGAVLPYKVIFVIFIVIGMMIGRFQTVYDLSDGLVGVMALCNLPAVLLLSPTVLRAARNYFGRLDRGEMPPVGEVRR
jgi:AGCS family alanine or glycine:cation symporter